MAEAIWNDRWILSNGAVSANAPLSGDGSNSQPLGLDLKTDNSLSGNGTLTSPLGVVPGYNETVLYSGNSNITTGALNEPATNFNYLRVSFAEKENGAAYPGGQLVSYLDINECLVGNNIRSACAGLSYHELGTNVALGLRVGIFYLTSPTSFSSYHVEKQTNSTAAANNIGNMFVTKVIGINRKQ